MARQRRDTGTTKYNGDCRVPFGFAGYVRFIGYHELSESEKGGDIM